MEKRPHITLERGVSLEVLTSDENRKLLIGVRTLFARYQRVILSYCETMPRSLPRERWYQGYFNLDAQDFMSRDFRPDEEVICPTSLLRLNNNTSNDESDINQEEHESRSHPQDRDNSTPVHGATSSLHSSYTANQEASSINGTAGDDDYIETLSIGPGEENSLASSLSFRTFSEARNMTTICTLQSLCSIVWTFLPKPKPRQITISLT